MRQTILASLFAGVVGLLLGSSAGHAFELEPNEFVTAPAGTTALLGYFIYGNHDAYYPEGGSRITHDTSLSDYLGIARAAKYFDVGNIEALVEVLQPFGALTDAQIGGTRFAGSSGAGDTTLAAALWPINNKASRTYLGLAFYLTVPDGAYNSNRVVNLGGNRFVYDPEIALHQGFNDRWSVDLSADLIAYSNNTATGFQGNQTLSQDPTAQIQAFVNYSWGSQIVTSIGYEGEFGGRQTINETGTGGMTEFQEARFITSYNFTPAFQVLGEINHQFENTGGFKQNLGFTMRVLYAF